jgi:nucleoid-associated protein YgaU
MIMGLFDLFGKKFDEKVTDAITAMKAMNLGVKNLGADVQGKVVTLTGEAPSREVASMAMQKLDEMVSPDNIVNAIKVVEPKPEPAPAPETVPEVDPEEATERFHEVVAGDTLGHIAQKYYGKASEYMKIFEANRNILDDPNLIKVGQKLRIPE